MKLALLVLGFFSWLLFNPAITNAAACDPVAPKPGTVCTALGEIPTEQNSFVAWVLKFAIGIGGGIAILLIIFGTFQVMTSSGSPENLKKGQEKITSAIGGLIFIIFSLFLLKLIGVDILAIPGFKTP
jgi:hypothetical protein